MSEQSRKFRIRVGETVLEVPVLSSRGSTEIDIESPDGRRMYYLRISDGDGSLYVDRALCATRHNGVLYGNALVVQPLSCAKIRIAPMPYRKEPE